MGKKILILGNGFDLAHGLPTSYSDFLEFAKRFMAVWRFRRGKSEFVELYIRTWENGHPYIKEKIEQIFDERKLCKYKEKGSSLCAILDDDTYFELNECLDYNIWYEYFCKLLESNKIRGVNWIDFEAEISGIIQWLNINCNDMQESYKVAHIRMNQSGGKETEKTKIFYECSEKRFCNLAGDITVEKFVNYLYGDLEDITRALEIYLVKFVEEIKADKIPLIESIRPDYVMSFNYTHTYRRLYNSMIQICYIHGECKEDKCTNNMVLGIDEYLDDSEKNFNTNYCIFKKFIMRIRKKDGVEYQNWSREIDSIHSKQQRLVEKDKDYFKEDISDVYIYGHSLDKTDKDVLEMFLRPEYTSIHLYAKDKVDEGKLLSNLIRIVTEDVLIKKASMEKTRLVTVVI